MRRAILFGLSALPLLAARAEAHPGHGADGWDGHGALHYLIDHGLVVGLVAGAVTLGVMALRRGRR